MLQTLAQLKLQEVKQLIKKTGIEYAQFFLVEGPIGALQVQSQLENKEIQSISCVVEKFVLEKS